MLNSITLERYLNGENDTAVMFNGELLQVNTKNMQMLINTIAEMQDKVIKEVKRCKAEYQEMKESDLFSEYEIDKIADTMLEAENIAEILNISEEKNYE